MNMKGNIGQIFITNLINIEKVFEVQLHLISRCVFMSSYILFGFFKSFCSNAWFSQYAEVRATLITTYSLYKTQSQVKANSTLCTTQMYHQITQSQTKSVGTQRLVTIYIKRSLKQKQNKDSKCYKNLYKLYNDFEQNQTF